jgi:hypothetical protein
VAGFVYAKQRVVDFMGSAEPWRLHDLRRTATTGMARLGVAPHVADRVLNHQSGTISGVAAVYNRFAYLEARSDAFNGAPTRLRFEPIGGDILASPARWGGMFVERQPPGDAAPLRRLGATISR